MCVVALERRLSAPLERGTSNCCCSFFMLFLLLSFSCLLRGPAVLLFLCWCCCCSCLLLTFVFGKNDMMIRIWFMCRVIERGGERQSEWEGEETKRGRERDTALCLLWQRNKNLIQLIEIETEIESALLHLKVHFNYSKTNQINPIQFQYWIHLIRADFSLKLKLVTHFNWKLIPKWIEILRNT